MGKSSTNHNGIDLGKFLLSILVVSVHTSPLKSFSLDVNFWLVQILSRIAVPVFFTISGYLFFKKAETSTATKKIWKFEINAHYYNYIMRLLLVYMIWSLIYLFDVVHRYYVTMGLNWWQFGALYAYAAVIYGTYLHLWFFPAVVLAISLVHFLSKKYSIKKLLVAAFILFIIGLFGESYYGLIKDVDVINNFYQTIFAFMLTTRNGLFFGFFFVAMGAYLAKKPTLLPVMTSRKWLILSLGLLAVESLALHYLSDPIDHNLMFGLIPVAYFLFQYLASIKISERLDYRFLRDMSALIFFIHPLFIIWFDHYFDGFGVGYMAVRSIIKFSFVFTASFVSSFILLKMKEHGIFKSLISYLY
jgi:serine/alanine racemase